MTFRTLLIAVAVLALCVGASFGAGASYGRRASGSPSTATAPGGQVFQQGPNTGQGSPAGQPIVGTVLSANGNALTITDSNNRLVKVNLTDQTRIVKQATGTSADLTSGTRIAVQPQGQPGSDGTITAAMVQVVPAGQGGTLISR